MHWTSQDLLKSKIQLVLHDSLNFIFRWLYLGMINYVLLNHLYRVQRLFHHQHHQDLLLEDCLAILLRKILLLHTLECHIIFADLLDKVAHPPCGNTEGSSNVSDHLLLN